MANKDKIQYLLNLLADAVSLLVSVVAAWLVTDKVLHVLLDYTLQDWNQFILILVLSFVVVFALFNGSSGLTRRGWKSELLLCVQNTILLGALLAVCLLMTKATLLESRYLYVGILTANAVCLYLSHTALKTYLNKYFYKGSLATLVGIITTSDRAPALIHDLKHDWDKKLQGVVLLDESEPGGKVDGVPVAAVYDTALEWIRHEPLDEVYVNVPYQSGDSLRPLLNEMESMGLCVHLNLTVLEPYTSAARQSGEWFPRLQTTVETAGGVPFVTISAGEHDFDAMILKRLMDIVGALVGLIISVPIIAVTAIPLKLESPGPLFFRQKRVGLNGRTFYICKLRSMYMDAEQRKKDLMAQNKMQGLMFKMDDDPRITKVGKFIRRTSIDELPQFWNILKGDMSLVGTRPPTLDEYEQYDSHHKRRLSMKPGLTGLWQVSGRSNIQNFEEVVKLDVAYIDNWSLGLDVRILVKTIGVVFRRTGAE